MKKVMSVLLSLILLASLSVTVFAGKDPEETTTVQYSVDPSYTTYIPPTVTAGDDLTIGASANVDPGTWLVVKISDGVNNGNVTLYRQGVNGLPEDPAEGNVNILSVPIRTGDHLVGDNNTIVALFDGTEPVEIATRSVSVGAPDTTGKKAGNYVGRVTFSFSCQSMADTVRPVVPTEDGVYILWNDLDWMWFVSQTESYMYSKTSDLCGKTIKLNNNIDLTPYGNAAMAIVPAGATFDGRNNSVKVNFNRKESSGLFQVADSCTIKNLNLTGSMSVVNGRVGMIALALTDQGPVSIDQCANQAVIRMAADISALNVAGGIVGMTDGSNKVEITNCYNNGEISATGTEKSVSGGIAGVIANNAIGNLIQYCINNNNIYTTQNAGGIIGGTSEELTIDTCTNWGALNQSGSNVTYTYPIFNLNSGSQLVVTNCNPAYQNGTFINREK